MQKICFFAPTRYAPSRLHQVDIAPSRRAPSQYCTKLICTKSMHQLDVHQVGCTKLILHQVDQDPVKVLLSAEFMDATKIWYNGTFDILIMP